MYTLFFVPLYGTRQKYVNYVDCQNGLTVFFLIMDYFLRTNIKHLRKCHAITQEGLALQVKKTRTTINNWESGVSMPNLEEVALLSNIFDVPGPDLLFSDLTTVQVSKGRTGPKNQKNVQGNVQVNVQADDKKAYESASKSSPDGEMEQPGPDDLSAGQLYGIAIRSLEAANAALLRENEALRAELERLKNEGENS